jgi:hypothetical protein
LIAHKSSLKKSDNASGKKISVSTPKTLPVVRQNPEEWNLVRVVVVCVCVCAYLLLVCISLLRDLGLLISRRRRMTWARRPSGWWTKVATSSCSEAS